MKKSIYFGALMLAILTSCTKENSQGIEVDGQHSFRINTTAPCLETDDADTKASMKATVRLQWNDGDEISVVNLSTGKTMLGNLTAKVNGDKVSFEGELSGSIKAGNKMAAIYPCQNYSGITTVPDFALDLSNQTCSTKDDLKFAAYSLFDCKTTGVVEVTSDFVVPVSFNQITLATIDPETKIDYVELTNVGNGITFHVNSSEGKLELTPSIGKVRVTPQSKLSEKNGALFAYCALAESPASSRAVTVKALPKIYYATWAESAMSASKFYTSIASDFETQEYKDFMVSAPSSLEVGYQGGTVSFSVTSNNISWTASSTPSLNIAPSSGKGCENLEVVVTVPQNDETAERTFLVTLTGGSEEYHYSINQKADPHKEIIAFADINLKKYMLPLFDEDEDGEINASEAENVQNVNCSGRNIADLSGLEKCPNLKYLNCNGNYISEIILPNLSKLETIIAYGNPIEKIVVNNDTSLSGLYLKDANTNAIFDDHTIRIDAYDQASTLYIAFAGTKYTILKIINSDVLTGYDVSENVQVTEFYAGNNTKVTEVDLSSLVNLKITTLYNCSLNELNVSTNLALTRLECHKNNLTSINLDSNTLLEYLNASGNKLSSLRLQNNIALTDVNVENNQLQSLNVRRCTQLTSLNIGNNKDIIALALGYNTMLETLKANDTGLTDIDLSGTVKLQYLDISGCSDLSVINLSTNVMLQHLAISSTPIFALDVTNNTAIEYLDASSTAIPSINLSNNRALKTLNVKNIPTLNELSLTTNSALVNLDFDNGLSITSGFSVGRYIVANGVAGVTFYASGTETKIISMDEAEKTWSTSNSSFGTNTTDGYKNTERILSISNAAKWCVGHGTGWYLPARDELKTLSSVYKTINTTLSNKGGTALKAGGNLSDAYWSSSEITEYKDYPTYGYPWAYSVYMMGGDTAGYTTRNSNHPVRAVLKF